MKIFHLPVFCNLEIGMATVRTHRITYVGELGWELYFPIEFSNYIAELIESAGEKFSLKLCGMHAVDSCRIEKLTDILVTTLQMKIMYSMQVLDLL